MCNLETINGFVFGLMVGFVLAVGAMYIDFRLTKAKQVNRDESSK